MGIPNELQQQIIEAEAKVNELREKLNAQRKTERLQAMTAAKELVRIHALTAAELGLSGKKPVARKSSDGRAIVPPKYRDPTNGKTWTGRGKTPAWLAAQIATGRSKQDFLI